MTVKVTSKNHHLRTRRGVSGHFVTALRRDWHNIFEHKIPSGCAGGFKSCVKVVWTKLKLFVLWRIALRCRELSRHYKTDPPPTVFFYMLPSQKWSGQSKNTGLRDNGESLMNKNTFFFCFTLASAVVKHTCICSSHSENQLGLDVPLLPLLDNAITYSLYIFSL